MRKITLALTAAITLVTALAVWAASRHNFPDVPASHPQALDIEQAVDAGWFQGYDDGTFRPGREVPLEQIAKVVKRALKAGSTRADLASLFARGLNEDYKRGEWEVSRSRWERAKEAAEFAPYARMSESECPDRDRQHLDHRVPVRRVNDSGGWRWSVATKEAFYLDASNLFRMCADDNRAKSDRYSDSRWAPPANAKADYDTAWRALAAKWDLDWNKLVAEGNSSPTTTTTTTTTTTPAATTTTTTTTRTPTPAGDEVLWKRLRNTKCADWERVAGTDKAGLRRIATAARQAGFAWGNADRNRDGYPCEAQLGKRGTY